MNAPAAPFLILALTLLACGRPGSASDNSSLTDDDNINYYVESDGTKENNPYNIEYGKRVVLKCSVNSLQNVSWYKRVQNTSYGIPLSSTFWGPEQYLQVDEYIGKTEATITKIADIFAGNYYCVATGSSPSVHGTTGINITIQSIPRLRDEGNETIIGCRSPNVRDIDTSRDTVSGVRNGTEYINVTLHWRYDPASMDNWCSASVFGVRYVTWDNVYDLPPFIKDPQVNAYERYEFDWEPWEVIPQGNRSVTIPFLRKDLYYLFQVAVPQSNLNVHTVWFSKNANRYSSRVTYYGEQRGVTIDRFPVKFINITEGTPVNLTCIARGVPKPSVAWLRKVSGVVHDQAIARNILIIEHARVSHSGTYVCSALNTILLADRIESRSVTDEVTLLVHPKPVESAKCIQMRPTECEAHLPTNASLWSTGEQELASANSIAADLKNLSKRNRMEVQCAELILELFCKLSMPVCSVNGTPMRVCQESCSMVFSQCGNVWTEARNVITELESLDRCLAFPDTPDSCVTVSGTEQASPTPAGVPMETDAQVIGVVIGVAALVVLMVMLLIAVCCYCRHASQSKFTSLSDLPTLDLESSSIRMSLSENPYYQRRRFVSISEKDMERLRQISKDEITYISELGQGNFGRVFKGEVSKLVPGQDVTTVAVKNLLEEDNEAAVKAFVHEAKIMSRFDHPNIVKLIAVSITNPPFYLVFEFMSEGDLNDYLHQRASSRLKRLMNPSPTRSRTESALSNEPSELTSEQLHHICLQIAEGMKYLADNNHVHRDLATRNCLVGEKLVVKIGDFGMSQHLYHNDYYRVHGEAALPVRWMPPESIVYGTFTTETDVWSFGVVMWEVFSFAMQPYYGKSNEEVCDLVRKGGSLECPDECPPEVYNLMQSCWSLTPNSRPSFKNLCVKLSLLSQGKAESPIMPRDTQSISSQDSTVFASSPAPSPFFGKDIPAYHPSDDSDMEA